MAGRKKPKGIGHNSANFSEVLRATYNTVADLNEQMLALSKAKSRAYADARAAGVNIRVLGDVLNRRQRNREDVLERDADVAAYEAILFGEEEAEEDDAS